MVDPWSAMSGRRSRGSPLINVISGRDPSSFRAHPGQLVGEPDRVDPMHVRLVVSSWDVPVVEFVRLFVNKAGCNATAAKDYCVIPRMTEALFGPGADPGVFSDVDSPFHTSSPLEMGAMGEEAFRFPINLSVSQGEVRRTTVSEAEFPRHEISLFDHLTLWEYRTSLALSISSALNQVHDKQGAREEVLTRDRPCRFCFSRPIHGLLVSLQANALMPLLCTANHGRVDTSSLFCGQR